MEIKSIFYIENFNTGFPAYIADVIIHLSQWQFWFWFWFNIFWILFLIILYKIFFYSNNKYSIQINTSLRSHGKWGDFLAAILPLTWCSGILINSNFILRTLEWQHENTLFTLRIHGRQWYWIFKYDIRTLSDIYNVKIKTGYKFLYLINDNKKLKKTFENLSFFFNSLLFKNTAIYFNYACERYENILLFDEIINEILLEKYNYWSDYWDEYLNNNNKNNYNNDNNNDLIDTKINYFSLYSYNKNNFIKKKNINFLENKIIYNFFIKKNKIINFKKFSGVELIENNWDVKWSIRKNNFKPPITIHVNSINKTNNINGLCNINNINIINNNKLSIFLFNFRNVNVDTNKNSFETFFNINYSKTGTSKNFINEKIIDNRLFYILKQRKIKKIYESKYNLYKIYKDFYKSYQFDEFFNNILNNKKKIFNFKDSLFGYIYSYKEKNINNLILSIYNNKYYINSINYKYLLERYLYKKKKLKKKEIFSFSLSKRLLKVKKTLLLPVATNIALVTSSYDVAHSLFIPAIGLKFDCVPGRATHHTLNILHKGVYYAQCAEICGRYHHHMPAKISVVFFEQFINWWKIKSLNIFIKLNETYILKNYFILNYYFTKIFTY